MWGCGGIFGGEDALNNGLVSRAAAEVPVEGLADVGFGIGGEFFGGHDHAGGAVAALEALLIQKALLHWR